jgi:CBS domain-containing protein
MSLERFTRRELVTAAPDQRVVDVARLMATSHVGAVLVVEGGRPVGIVTDRDLVLRYLAQDRPPRDAPIRDFMTGDLVVAQVNDAIDHALFTMRQRGIRRLPIVSADGTLVGLVALDDLLVLLGGEFNSLVETVMDNRGP